MIINVLKPCCYTCNSPDIQIDEYGDRNICFNVYISCAHDKVCKFYNESENSGLKDATMCM